METRYFLIADPGKKPFALVKQDKGTVYRWNKETGDWVEEQNLAEYLFGSPGTVRIEEDKVEESKKLPSLVVPIATQEEIQESLRVYSDTED